MNPRILSVFVFLMVVSACGGKKDASTQASVVNSNETSSYSAERNLQTALMSEDQIKAAVTQFEMLLRSQPLPIDPSDQSSSSFALDSVRTSGLTGGSVDLIQKKEPCQAVWEECLARRKQRSWYSRYPFMCQAEYAACLANTFAGP